MPEEEAKAVQEVAKATSNAIDAAREAGGFISKYIAGPLEQGMAIFEDRLKYMRWERQVRLRVRADEFLKQLGLESPTRPVPMKLAIPLIQAASLEEDNDLQDLWAALLANAADASCPIEIQRSYVSILEQLTPLETKILDRIYSLPFEQSQHDGVITEHLPDSARAAAKKGDTNTGNPSEAVCIALSNLQRLGCLRMGMTWGNGEMPARVNPTMLGRAFVRACTIQTA
jgi:hypothetical protein